MEELNRKFSYDYVPQEKQGVDSYQPEGSTQRAFSRFEEQHNDGNGTVLGNRADLEPKRQVVGYDHGMKSKLTVAQKKSLERQSMYIFWKDRKDLSQMDPLKRPWWIGLIAMTDEFRNDFSREDIEKIDNTWARLPIEGSKAFLNTFLLVITALSTRVVVRRSMLLSFTFTWKHNLVYTSMVMAGITASYKYLNNAQDQLLVRGTEGIWERYDFFRPEYVNHFDRLLYGNNYNGKI